MEFSTGKSFCLNFINNFQFLKSLSTKNKSMKPDFAGSGSSQRPGPAGFRFSRTGVPVLSWLSDDRAQNCSQTDPTRLQSNCRKNIDLMKQLWHALFRRSMSNKPGDYPRSMQELRAADPCWCGSGNPYRACHRPQDRSREKELGITRRKGSICDAFT
jgi:hypothetical protein